MNPRRVLGCALAAQLVAAGAVVVARLPSEPVDRVVAVAEPTATPPAPTATPTPTLVPTPPSPAPSLPVPPRPPITLPPLPSVSLPPLPSVSLPPVPLCPADAGTVELPNAVEREDLGREEDQTAGPISGGGRIWLSSPSRIVGIDPSNGSRVTVPVKPDTHVAEVVGDTAWTVENHIAVVAYDVRTGAETHRFDDTNLAYEEVPLHGAAVAADQTGAWILGIGTIDTETVESVWTVLRVRNDGTTVWHVRLPGRPGYTWASERGQAMVDHAGTVYVGAGELGDGTSAVWRVSPSGEVAHRELPGVRGHVINMPMAAGPGGLYAAVPTGQSDARVTRFDSDLRVLGSQQYAESVYDLFAGGGSVYVVGQECSFLLSRYDATSLRRTGFWRTDRWNQGNQGVVHGGEPWLFHQFEAKPVALLRYDLP